MRPMSVALMGIPEIRTLPELFLRCVDDDGDSVRFNPTEPWVQGDMIYASDGRIVARIPVDGVSPSLIARLTVDDERFKVHRCVRSIADVFDGTFSDTSLDLPVVHDPEWKCDACDDGFHKRYCQTCNFDRKFRGQTCRICEGKGHVFRLCRKCEGRGYLDVGGRVGIDLGPVILRHEFVYLMQHFGCTVYPSAKCPAKSTCKFVLGPIEGRVMPMVNDPI